jgi:ATP synthase protein I
VQRRRGGFATMCGSAREGGQKGKAVAPPPTDDFDERLNRARKRGGTPSENPSNPSLLGYAFRIGTELVAGVAVGGLIGWGLDYWLGTSPGFLILFFVLGTAAGFWNVFRSARAMNAGIDAGNPPAAPPDDDD